MFSWIKLFNRFFQWNTVEVPVQRDEIKCVPSFDDLHLFSSKGIIVDAPNPYIILAGPFYKKPSNIRGLCLEEQYYNVNNDTDDWLFPIPDFKVPRDKSAFRDILTEVYCHAKKEKIVYIGCKGGYGRTGMSIACLLKMHGSKNPIQEVRLLYDKRAIETPEQESFVNRF
jgi:hypothetical protein